ncbi:Ger(x)C family spore germination protein [Paenibacillus sp. GSMTC-2017]|uniref:Ger(x)C family spore germination protein n=1 Tax=Paenibacillus sp. GSMTC-2017 TaxID=2794350 RepID=UPI0018D88F48|nr:Ger(x)C family spore germination protein [Paenibacillus sp. GSMTC-2017]MBH5317331.1 Ger(x)C family spore germination protein [Paenibacillus sp. GSMTC-2017]
MNNLLGVKKVGGIRRGVAVSVVIMMCFLLSGCWDEVDLQDNSYMTALGIDFIEGKYVVYGQMISFVAIAKTEGPKSEPKQVWIGKSTGDSVLLALFHLSRTAQNILNLEHLETIVLHERAMNKVDEVLDGLNRQRASRYTSMIFGTNMPLDELFTTDAFFNESALSTILYNPKLQDQQFTFVHPFNMQTAVQKLKEPAMTTLIPALNFTEKYWKFKDQPLKTQMINGLFVFKNFKCQGYFKSDSVIGIRWLNEHFSRVLLKVSDQSGDASTAITNSKIKFKTTLENGESSFDLDLKLVGHILEHNGGMDEKKIAKLVENKVKEEIEAVYKLGIANQMDLLGLEHRLYRHHNSYWKEHAAKKGWMPRIDQLKLNVKFLITDTGKFDLVDDT